MKKTLLLLILLLPLVQAQYYDSEKINIDLTIGSELTVSRSANSALEYVRANLSFYPEDELTQKINDIKSVPKYKKDNGLLFEWYEPKENKLDFDVLYNIDLNNKPIKIKNNIQFPIKDLKADLIKYIEPSLTIDSNDDGIILLANNLVSGEDDLYIVVSKLGQWVQKNILYNLSTLTAQASQKSSWVLQNRYGVCDEITSLFIAMCRALDIPAKFVSGLAYTNFADRNEFGPHGWAEIYFPGYGWVPYDITYGELGKVNPARIKLKQGVDPDEASTRYEWRGRNVEVNAKKLDFDVVVNKKTGKTEQSVSINTIFYRDEINLGSYNVIIGELENLGDYYQTVQVASSKTSNIQILDERIKVVILKPNEKKKLFWKLKISDKLDKDFIYTFPVELYTTNNISHKSNFTAKYKAANYTKEQITQYVEYSSKEQEKTYSNNVEIYCNTDKEEYYLKDTIKVKCRFVNAGNTFLKDMSACVEDNCKQFDLGVTQEKSFEYTIFPEKEGQQELEIKVNNQDVSRIESLSINVKDKPSLRIDDIEYPAELEFNTDYTIQFMLIKESSSVPNNIVVKVIHSTYEKKWDVQLKNDRKIILNMNSRDMKSGLNSFDVEITYSDNEGKDYKDKEKIQINLVNVTLIQKVKMFFYSIERWLGSFV